MTTDKEHLQWMLNRLAEVHGENRNIDYMVRMQKIIDSTKTELNLHLVSCLFSAEKVEEAYDDGHYDGQIQRSKTFDIETYS